MCAITHKAANNAKCQANKPPVTDEVQCKEACGELNGTWVGSWKAASQTTHPAAGGGAMTSTDGISVLQA